MGGSGSGSARGGERELGAGSRVRCLGDEAWRILEKKSVYPDSDADEIGTRGDEDGCCCFRRG